MKTALLSVIAASLVSAVAVAPAQAETTNPRVEVSYADLDIQSATGAATLAGRIQASVNQACVRTSDIREIQSVAACKNVLISDAVVQLDGKGAAVAAGHLSANG